VRLSALAMMVLAVSLAACTSPGSSTSPGLRSSTKADLAVCTTLDGDFYYPTVPASGEHVTLVAARDILRLLNRAHDSKLRTAASGLRRAIEHHDQASLLNVFTKLQGVCTGLEGIPPAT
jgi:hypothetical protein